MSRLRRRSRPSARSSRAAPSSAAAGRTRRRRTTAALSDEPWPTMRIVVAPRSRARAADARVTRPRARAGARSACGCSRISARKCGAERLGQRGGLRQRHALRRRRRRARSRGCRRARRGRPGSRRRGGRRRGGRARGPGRTVAASSASASGTPSAWRFRTASIIVSALPASTPSSPRTTPSRTLDLEAAEAVGAVAHARAGDGVGDERDAAGRRAPDEPRRLLGAGGRRRG